MAASKDEPIIELVEVVNWGAIIVALIIGGAVATALLWSLAAYQRRDANA